MAHHDLTTPLTEADVRQLKLEDTVSLSGVIFGIRDATQIRIFDEGVPPPVSMEGGACLHTAPGVRKLPNGKYEKLSIGTTTSTRMDRFVPGLIEQYGVRAVIGKGGLLAGSVDSRPSTRGTPPRTGMMATFEHLLSRSCIGNFRPG